MLDYRWSKSMYDTGGDSVPLPSLCPCSPSLPPSLPPSLSPKRFLLLCGLQVVVAVALETGSMRILSDTGGVPLHHVTTLSAYGSDADTFCCNATHPWSPAPLTTHSPLISLPTDHTPTLGLPPHLPQRWVPQSWPSYAAYSHAAPAPVIHRQRRECRAHDR
jgi:hypothetical protein